MSILAFLRWGTLRKAQYRNTVRKIGKYSTEIPCQKQMKNRYRIYDLNYGAGSLSQTEPLPCLVCKGLAFHRGGLGEVLLPRGPFLESPGNFTGPKSNIQIEI